MDHTFFKAWETLKMHFLGNGHGKVLEYDSTGSQMAIDMYLHLFSI